MKNSISDLFDSMEYSPLKTKAADIVSAERVKELTMNRLSDNIMTEPRAFRGLRSLAVVLIAAALFIVLCGAAYATNLFSIRELLGNRFAGAGTQLEDSDIDSLQEVGAVKVPTATSDGTSITVTAAVYDGGSYYLALKIVAPQGTVLDCGESFWQIWGDLPGENLSLTLPSGFGVSTMFYDETPGDNEITLVVETVTDSGVFGNGESKILTIHGLWLQSPDKVYTKVLDGEWSFDLEAIGVNGTIPGTETEMDESGGIDPISGEPRPLGDQGD